MNKLSDEKLASFLEKSKELIILKQEGIKTLQKLQDSVMYTHADYIVEPLGWTNKLIIKQINKGDIKTTSFKKEGSIDLIMKYIKENNINIIKVFFTKGSKEQLTKWELKNLKNKE